MRTVGGGLLVLGFAGFLYCSSRLDKEQPVPEEKTLTEALEYPAGRWELGRYACAAAAALGVLIAIFPKGR